MALLAGGWALSLSSPGFEVALPLVAVVVAVHRRLRRARPLRT